VNAEQVVVVVLELLELDLVQAESWQAAECDLALIGAVVLLRRLLDAWKPIG